MGLSEDNTSRIEFGTGLNEDDVFILDFSVSFGGARTGYHMSQDIAELAVRVQSVATVVISEVGNVRSTRQLFRAFGNIATFFRPNDDTAQ